MEEEDLIEIMTGRPDMEKFWKLLAGTGKNTMTIKLFRKEGDQDQSRAIILLSGEQHIKALTAFLDAHESTKR